MIEKLDFVGVPTQDVERAKEFYGGTLGLRKDDKSDAEFWVGETCLGIWEPEQQGMKFAPQKNGHLALHVADVAEARASLEERASCSRATPSTRACARWPCSPTPTATT